MQASLLFTLAIASSGSQLTEADARDSAAKRTVTAAGGQAGEEGVGVVVFGGRRG